jgi:hypothetical protein
LSLFVQRMSSLQKKPGIPARSVKKVVKRAAKKVAEKAAKPAGSALAIVTRRAQPNPRVVKHARATWRALPGRARSFVKRNPVRVLLGASALGLVLAKLRQLV